IVPIAYTTAAWVLLETSARFVPRSLHRAVPVFLAAVLAGTSLLQYGDAYARNPADRPRDVIDSSASLRTDERLVGEWMHEHLPPDITVAQATAGATAYYSQ